MRNKQKPDQTQNMTVLALLGQHYAFQVYICNTVRI